MESVRDRVSPMNWNSERARSDRPGTTGRIEIGRPAASRGMTGVGIEG